MYRWACFAKQILDGIKVGRRAVNADNGRSLRGIEEAAADRQQDHPVTERKKSGRGADRETEERSAGAITGGYRNQIERP